MNENRRKSKPGKALRRFIIIVALIILLVVASDSFFFLEEGESALVQRFGDFVAVYMREVPDEVRAQLETRPDLSIHVGTGLKFKLPFIENVVKYPSKLILYDSPPTEVLTLDRHRMHFDNTAQWRIINPLLFYEAYNNLERAKVRLDDVLYSEMRICVGRLNSYTIISDRETSNQMLLDLTESISRIFAETGISVVDIRIKRTNLPSETYGNIYNRMNTERQQAAAWNRSEGEREFLEIRSKTDREVISITSTANRIAEETRGKGDSEAARIYNNAYSRDPDFFEFYNLLDTYRMTVGQRSTMVIPLNSPFAKYLLGNPIEAAPAPDVPDLPDFPDFPDLSTAEPDNGDD